MDRLLRKGVSLLYSSYAVWLEGETMNVSSASNLFVLELCVDILVVD